MEVLVIAFFCSGIGAIGAIFFRLFPQFGVMRNSMMLITQNAPTVTLTHDIILRTDLFDKYSSWLKEGEGGSLLDKTSSLYPDSLIEVLGLNLVGTGYPRLYLHLDTNI